jgi:hypothetical protein
MVDMLDELAALPSTDGYSAKDRYHDFRRIFMGSDEGRRVMAEILSWGRLMQPWGFSSPIDPYQMALREGQRNIALKLLDTVLREPPERPERAARKR